MKTKHGRIIGRWVELDHRSLRHGKVGPCTDHGLQIHHYLFGKWRRHTTHVVGYFEAYRIVTGLFILNNRVVCGGSRTISKIPAPLLNWTVAGSASIAEFGIAALTQGIRRYGKHSHGFVVKRRQGFGS